MKVLRNFKCLLDHEFKNYNRQKFGKDLIAGITVAAVALPLALAFGVGSGADAAAGLITAVIAGIVIGAFSGTSFQISGPTGAMTAILIPLVAKYGLATLFVASFLAGIILIIAGLIKAGKVLSFVPSSVITGFTSGIAIVIALGEVPNLLGVKAHGENVIEKVTSSLEQFTNFNYTSLILGLFVVLFMIVWPKRLSKVIPSSLIAIIITSIFVSIFSLDVGLVGNIPQTLLHDQRLNFLELASVDWDVVVLPAFSIAILCMIESLLSGSVGCKMKKEKMDANQEIIAQGIGNVIIPFFGGVPATAAIARTSVAIKSGSQTRLTSIIHGLVLIISIFILSNLMANIPLAALSGVLIVTAWRMNEWHSIKYIFNRRFKGAMSKFLITMIVTVVFDLTIAIAVGVLIAVVLLLAKMSKIHVHEASVDYDLLDRPVTLNTDIKIVYIEGFLFFGVVDFLEKKLETIHDNVIILSMRGVPQIDTSVANSLHDFCLEAKSKGQTIVFSSLQTDVIRVLKKAGITDIYGENIFFKSTKEAIYHFDIHEQ